MAMRQIIYEFNGHITLTNLSVNKEVNSITKYPVSQVFQYFGT